VAASRERRRLSMLGVPLDTVRPAEARAALRAFLADSAGGHCRHVVTLNPEYVMMAQRNRVFFDAVGRGDLIVADGVGVAVAARLLGGAAGRRVERVTGTDLVDWLAVESAPRTAPLFLLGGGPGVAEKAACGLLARIPEARIAGWWGGGTAAERDDEKTMARIRASGARAVLVAYGAPGQVLWIDRNRSALAGAGVQVAIGVGGVLDFLAGNVPRAPSVVRRAGLEWLYRLMREPWRWRRQAVLPVFFVRVLIEWLWRRGNRAGKIARPKSS
jgi:N-acetylglucosaminyldiphosphoundecaprenol N-acetyl-beta-D-mannosaminyltransferase